MSFSKLYQFSYNYFGHPPEHLTTLVSAWRKERKNIVFLAGDSSLDNKVWIPTLDQERLLPCYNPLLEDDEKKANISGVPDVAHWWNTYLDVMAYSLPEKWQVLNCAVESSTLLDRGGALKDNPKFQIFMKTHALDMDVCLHTNLLPQDRLINKYITNRDILVVSVGCNDIVLRPTLKTIVKMGQLLYLNSLKTMQDAPQNAWGFAYFVDLFKTKIEAYIWKLIGDVKPLKILVCTIYFPDVEPGESWAEFILNLIDYKRGSKGAQFLQATIKAIFEHATKQIQIAGCEIVPVPLFKVLDGSVSKDFVDRVEPSKTGGDKMARFLHDHAFPKTLPL